MEIAFLDQALFVKQRKNCELFQIEKVRGYGSKIYLSTIGLYIFVSKLELANLAKERKDFIIGAVHHMAESAVMRDRGELIHVDDAVDLSTIPVKSKKKWLRKDNGLRRAAFVKACRERHPSAPNTYNKLHVLTKYDHNMVIGDEANYEAKWREKLKGKEVEDCSYHDFLSGSAILLGKTEPDEITRYLLKVTKGLPEKYLSRGLRLLQIETTTQTKLIGGDSA